MHIAINIAMLDVCDHSRKFSKAKREHWRRIQMNINMFQNTNKELHDTTRVCLAGLLFVNCDKQEFDIYMKRSITSPDHIRHNYKYLALYSNLLGHGAKIKIIRLVKSTTNTTKQKLRRGKHTVINCTYHKGQSMGLLNKSQQDQTMAEDINKHQHLLQY